MMQIPMIAPKLVKLTQASGKRLLLPGTAIKAVETMTEEEVRAAGVLSHKGPAVGVWLDAQGNGTLLSAVLKDKFGWVVSQIGDGLPRAEFRGRGAKRISLALATIRGAQELDGGEGNEPVTLLQTSMLTATGGAVTYAVIDTADEILDRIDDSSELPPLIEADFAETAVN